MKRIVQSIYDPPVYLYDGETLRDTHIIRGGPEYGHIIFKHSPCVLVIGSYVTVEDCFIEFI